MHKNRLFFEVRRDFWFKSFLLDQKNFVVCENIWFLVIDRHCSSLLRIFSNFPRFFRLPRNAENDENEHKDEQWREIIYIHNIQSISSPIKKVWIKNLVGLRKTKFFCIFRFFGDFWRKIATQRVSPKISQKIEIFKIVVLRVAKRFSIQTFFVGPMDMWSCWKHFFWTGGGFFRDRRRVFTEHHFEPAVWGAGKPTSRNLI